MTFCSPVLALLFLALTVVFSQKADSADSSLFDETNFQETSQTVILYVPNFSGYFNAFDPFSFFDISIPPIKDVLDEDDAEIDLDDNSDQDSNFDGFWTLPGINYFLSFWSQELEEPMTVIDTESEPSNYLNYRRPELYMSCSICEWLIEKVELFLDYSNQVSDEDFISVLFSDCSEWGLSTSYCEFIVYDMVPEVIEWIQEGNNLKEYCKCREDETTESSTGSTGENSDTSDGTEEYAIPVSTVVVVILLSAILFGISLMTIRACLYVRENFKTGTSLPVETHISDEELAQPTLPSYTEIQSLVNKDEPPKYAFSAQDAALPPQYQSDIYPDIPTNPSNI